ncbi:MAG: DUF748 domain-containing protein [Candidatus Omnitrophota bacterium]
MLRRLLIVIVLLCVAIGAAVYFYRYRVIQYSAENIIRNALPDFVRIDTITFDARNSRISLDGFKVLNPPGSSEKYLLEIGKVSCSYRMMGKSPLDGFEIFDPLFKDFVLRIERSRDGKTNIEGMGEVVQPGSGSRPAAARPSGNPQGVLVSKLTGGKKPSEILKLPETFTISGGRIIFTDRFIGPRPNIITFENIEGRVTVRFDDTYTKVLALSSAGEGNLSGNRGEVIKWDVSLDPATPKLTMSNRFEVSGLDILTFEPYYDKYAPFVFNKGKFSGTLIFDFDNGSIGSTNEVHISDFVFYIKRGYENAGFWQTSVQDLAKYFATPSGEVVFDFKIKGEIGDPKFYLGPISKQALASMAVDKITDVIGQMGSRGEGAATGQKTDIEKAKEYIDIFKGLINKK